MTTTDLIPLVRGVIVFLIAFTILLFLISIPGMFGPIELLLALIVAIGLTIWDARRRRPQ